MQYRSFGGREEPSLCTNPVAGPLIISNVLHHASTNRGHGVKQSAAHAHARDTFCCSLGG